MGHSEEIEHNSVAREVGRGKGVPSAKMSNGPE